MKPFFSVLIPVCNQVGLMDDCISALKNQIFSDFEAIMVDDGSTDDSYKMLCDFAKEDSRIKVLQHEVNKSLLAARFTAMEEATGQYVFFLDSDDYIENDSFEKLHEYLIKNSVEAVRFGYVIEPQGERVLPVTCDDPLLGFLTQQFPPAIWKNCFKTEVVKEAISKYKSFYCNMGEDSFMSTLLFTHVKSWGVLNEYLYHYNTGVGMSAKKTMAPEKFKKGLESVVASGNGLLEIIKNEKPDYYEIAKNAVNMMKLFMFSQALSQENEFPNYVKLINVVGELGLEEDFANLCNFNLADKVFTKYKVRERFAPDISVIIPLYNAKDFICHTVDSALNQTKKEIEIILVDDCSTDGSADFCEEHYKDESRVKVVRQKKNGGPGLARNTGIKLARGKYVAFLDSDDQYLPTYLQELFNCAEEYNADVVHSTGCLMPAVDDVPIDLLSIPEESLAWISLDHPVEPYTKTFVLDWDKEKLFEEWTKHSIHWAIWNKLYRKDFLIKNNIEFGKMKFAEDHHFIFTCLFNDPKYVVLPGAGYIYRIIETSISRGAKNIQFLLRTLRAEFEGAEAIIKTMKEIPFFAEDKIRANKAVAYLQDGIEFGYLRTTFWEIGAEEIKNNKEVFELFEEFFGNQAAYMFTMFIEAHEFRQPAGEAELKKFNSPSFMKKLVEANRIKSLKTHNEEMN